MKALNSERQWGWVAQLFHWTLALAILGNFALGWYAHRMDTTPRKLEYFLWHKSIGLTILALALLRLVWRWSQPARPELPDTMARWQRWASQASHGLLYALMVTIPLVGWILNSAANVPLRWFGWFQVPDLVAPDDQLKSLAEWWHWALAWSLLWLAVVHIAAALKHHFVDRDTVLARMLPGDVSKS